MLEREEEPISTHSCAWSEAPEVSRKERALKKCQTLSMLEVKGE